MLWKTLMSFCILEVRGTLKQYINQINFLKMHFKMTLQDIDLWTFRDLDFSRVVLSRPMIGPFATLYFSHLFDPSRFATSVIFAVCRQLTVNYSLTTSCIQSFLLISISQFYFRTIKVVL